MTLSQIFLLSPRGDTIIFKDFKGNVPKVRGQAQRPRKAASKPTAAAAASQQAAVHLPPSELL